ncbi:hypothetical protein J3459_015349 [Metarhizium acridum]|nr:hypothetical protein J3459_015349 [Metarhizium acridum]
MNQQATLPRGYGSNTTAICVSRLEVNSTAWTGPHAPFSVVFPTNTQVISHHKQPVTGRATSCRAGPLSPSMGSAKGPCIVAPPTSEGQVAVANARGAVGCQMGILGMFGWL